MEHDLFGKPVSTFPDHALVLYKLLKRSTSGNRPVERQCAKFAFADERSIEHLMIGAARHFHCAECSQVIGHKLGIEQAVVTGPQPGHEMHQRDLRSIARAVE